MNLQDSVDVQQLQDLVARYRYGRYCEDPNLNLEDSRRLVFDSVQTALASKDSHAICATSGSGQLAGIIVFRISQWDTEHFGFKFCIIDYLFTAPSTYEQEFEVTQVLLRAFQDWVQQNNVQFVSTRVPALDLAVIHGLESQGFRFIESWIYNKYDLRKGIEPKVNLPLRLAQANDYNFMLQFSKDAFVTHRFYADLRFSRDKAQSLYEKWITTAFNDPNQEILVLDVDNSPTAFMIYYKSDLQSYFGLKFAMWKMALINPLSRGKGIGTDFFLALLHHHCNDGLDLVDSGLSARNLTSLNLHNKLNFKVITTVLTFHKWID